ncbi:MAG: LacI family DNA-binding transcriptional regulator, partial [Deinococcota bacterium]
MPSIKDVAKTAGVSITTVSFVLNNKGNIPQKTRDHVLDVVKNLGYTRNTSARTLRDKLSRTIGYAKPAAQRAVHPIMDKFLSEVIVQAEQRGWHVLIYASPADDPLAVYQEIISSQRVDGILLASAEQDDPRVAFLHEHNFPFVTLGRSLSSLDTCTSWVDIDSKMALYTVTEHLLEAGHTRIGVVAPAEGLVTGLRLAGYAACLEAHNLPVEDSLIAQQGHGDSKDGYLAAQTLLTRENPPT